MKRKEWNILVESWNKYLNESPVDISGINKIKSLVDRIKMLREETGKDIKLSVDVFEHDTKMLRVQILNYGSDNLGRTNFVYFNKIKDESGRYRLIDKDVFVNDNRGNSRESYQVKKSEVAGGFGPLLYEIGLEIISCRFNGALMSDRMSVSDDAKKVWERYDRRADSEFNLNSVKMSFNDLTISDMVGDGIDGKDNLEGMIDKDNDDLPLMYRPLGSNKMYQYGSLENMIDSGEELSNDWSEVDSVLMYAFYKDQPEILNYIEDLEKDLGYKLLSITL